MRKKRLLTLKGRVVEVEVHQPGAYLLEFKALRKIN
jgi:hypothetical protein